MDKLKTEKKKKEIHRAVLDDDNNTKINQWLKQVLDHHTGFKITKNQLVNWKIANQKEQLTSKELNELKQKFFDHSSYLKWVARDIEKKQARGESYELSEYMKVIASKAKKTAIRSKNQALKKPNLESKRKEACYE